MNNAEARLHKWIHYFDVYEHHFHRFIGQKLTTLEVGIFGGGSLKMWKEYFGDGAKVVGIDINPECKKHDGEGVEIFIGDQSDSDLLNRVIEASPQIDIVLDDGSHQQGDMIASFDYLYHKISPNGLYMVEDTHTSYWEEYGGGHLTAWSFIEFAKRKVDDLNAVHSR